MSVRSNLRRVGRALARPPVYLTLLVLVVALLIWFAGPYLGYGETWPLSSVSVRLGLLLLLALVWGIGGTLMRVRRSNEEQALVAALRKQQEEREASADREAADVERRFQDFRASARAARRVLGRASADWTPWYVVLGSSESGKTSLSLGLSDTTSEDETDAKNMPAARFHVSDDAVLVELDGAFFQQDEEWTRKLWPRVLDHLRSQRARQPLNGILISLGVDEILESTTEQLLDIAVAARKRCEEIGARLRSRTPVYVVVTKLDLLLGFEDFFESLSAENREAAFGFPIARLEGQSQIDAADAFSNGFAVVLEDLCSQVMMRLYEEPDELRRRRINELPLQFALLRQKLAPVVQHLTATTRFTTPPLTRGIFFVSSRQDSAFVDPAAPALSGEFGYGRDGLRAPLPMLAARNRPFFLHGLLKEVLLPERGIAGLTRPGRMLLQLQGIGANIALALVAIAFLVVWWLAFSEGRAYVERLDEGVTQARQSIAEAAPEGSTATDFEAVLDALDDLRSLSLEEPRRTTAALYGTGNVRQASRLVYERALSDMALPFLWRYLRDGLDAAATPAALRLQQLKLYLMLGGERPLDPATARAVAPDFAARWLANDRSPSTDASVAIHLAEFAEIELAMPLVDLRLVDRARGRIADYSLARVAYDILLATPAVAAQSAWRPVDQMGLAGPQALSRVSGSSFWEGVPGLYTSGGYKGLALPLSRNAADAVAQDLWAMGSGEGIADRERERLRIRDGLLDLYRVDYISQWESLLSDLDIAQAASAGELARAVALAIGQPSPVKELLTAIARETDLAAATSSPLDEVPGMAAGLQQAQDAVIGARPVIDVPGTVSEHFRPYREAVIAAEGQQAQLDVMLAAMEPLYRQINHVAAGGDVLELGSDPQTVLADLTSRVEAMPQSLQPLFRRILNKAAAVTAGSSRQRLADIWRTMVLPLCEATTEGRYPFVPGSRRDTSLADFASLFGPKGAIASFRNDYLRPFVDSSTKPWQWRAGQQFGLDLDDDVLLAFERADEIATAYFGGADEPKVAFTLEPVRLDNRARAFQFDVGGSVFTYTHGPPTPAPFTWPPDNPAAEAILSMTPELDGERNMLRFQGPWALFRLFDAGRILVPDATDIVPYQFNIGSRSLRLTVTAPPTRNPFARDILSTFSCPDLG